MLSIEMALCEVTYRNCAGDPVGFRGLAEADAVMRLHAAHGPHCTLYLAALAYLSAGIED